MNDEKKFILFGAGAVGEIALRYFGSRNVFCFVDNHKHGSMYFGKSVVSFEELTKIHEKYSVIVSSFGENLAEMCEQLSSAGIDHTSFRDFCAHDVPLVESIKKFENAYQGQKIFLLGNGPSLSVKDLELLQKNKIKTFACNFINKLFDKTNWRPDFYCVQESSVVLLNKNFIVEHHTNIVKFIKSMVNTKYANTFAGCRDMDYLHFFNHSDVRERFSFDASKLVHEGFTVMYSMLQLAVYMGFREIYLLGVENTQPPFVHTSNFIESNAHFYEESEEELEERRKIMNPHPISDNWDLYQKNLNFYYGLAKKSAATVGVKIFNATRGGKLEVFERVDFDSLF